MLFSMFGRVYLSARITFTYTIHNPVLHQKHTHKSEKQYILQSILSPELTIDTIT